MSQALAILRSWSPPVPEIPPWTELLLVPSKPSMSVRSIVSNLCNTGRSLYRVRRLDLDLA